MKIIIAGGRSFINYRALKDVCEYVTRKLNLKLINNNIMKMIQVYKCDYCSKYLVNVTQMKIHEKTCFYNPDSKSCITCKNLDLVSTLNGTPITEREENILRYKIEGTYNLVTGHDEEHYYQLKKAYQYLYECDVENGCSAKQELLKKLTTNCNSHKIKD